MLADNISIITTADGSKTLYNSSINEHYHSINGALQESQHVFVNNGLTYFHQLHKPTTIRILEIGFGTGLNFLLSAEYASANKLLLEYEGLETFPLSKSMLMETNYIEYLKDPDLWENFLEKHNDCYYSINNIIQDISLQLHNTSLLDFKSDKKFDIIYFDAFAKSKQAEMWTAESITSACKFLKDKGIFVTYSVTGDLKRTLKSLGFEIQRPEGAAGKREMMRATFIQENAL